MKTFLIAELLPGLVKASIIVRAHWDKLDDKILNRVGAFGIGFGRICGDN